LRQSHRRLRLLGADLRPRYIKWVNNERYVIAVEKSDEFRGTPFTVTQLYTKSLDEEEGRFVLRPKIFRQFNDRVGRGMTSSGREVMRIYDAENDSWDVYDNYPGLTPDTPIFGFLKDGAEVIIGDYKGRDTRMIIKK